MVLFKMIGMKIFSLKNKKEDLDTAYEITTYAKYKGHNFEY